MNNNACRSLFLSISLLAVVSPFNMLSEGVNVSDFKPSVKVGQKWWIEETQMTKPPMSVSRRKELAGWNPREIKSVYEFSVLRFDEVDKDSVCCIKVSLVLMDGEEVNPDGFRMVFLRASDFSVKKLEGWIGPPPWDKKKALECYESKIFDGEPVMADFIFYAPLDSFPSFSRKPSLDLVKNKKDFVQKNESIKFPWANKESDAVRVTIESSDKASPRPIKNSQIWIKGMPWWVEAKSDEILGSGKHRVKSAKLLLDKPSPDKKKEGEKRDGKLPPSLTPAP